MFNQFFNEIENQFLSDGGNIEGSSGYHLLSNEMIIIGFEVFLKLILDFQNQKKSQKNLKTRKITSKFNKVDLIYKNSKKINKIQIKEFVKESDKD